MFTGWHDRSRRVSAWNAQPVTCPQWTWEIEAAAAIYRERNPNLTVEIGVYYGGSLLHWLKNGDGMVIGIDPEPRVDFVHPRLTILPMTGAEALGKISEPVDWLFIDALHDYESVRWDFDHFGPLVRPGGVIGLHDIVTPDCGVPRLWREIQAAGYVTQELLAANTHQGGIGLVYV